MTFNFAEYKTANVSVVKKTSNNLAKNSKFTLKLLPFGLTVTNLLKSEITLLVNDKWVRWVGRVTVVVCAEGAHRIATEFTSSIGGMFYSCFFVQEFH